ncbi:MAG: hypothetical protein R6U92_05025 [Bacillota bacterium]
MLFVVVGVAGILVVSYLALDYVFTQYKHTKRSRVVLAVEAVVCVILGLFLGSSLPGLPWYFSASIGLAMGLLAYSALVVTTVEMWRRVLPGAQNSPDVEDLQRKLEDLQGQYETITDEISALNAEKKALERDHDEELFRQRQLENQVHRWKGGGGMERIRSLRVEDWIREMADMEDEELRSMREELRERRDVEDTERGEALRVRAALADLELLRRSMAEPNRELAQIKRAIEAAENKKGSLATQMRELDRELRSWNRFREEESRDRTELR